MGDVDFSELAKTEGLNAIKEVRQDSSAKNWVIFGYEDKKVVTYKASGDGGLNELKQNFKDDEIQYALLKVVDIFDNLPVTRFVWIVWTGAHVKIFIKASITTHRGKVKEFMGQSHVTLDASSLDELTEEIISQKVSDASGSSNRVLTGDNQRQQKTNVGKQQSKIETGDLCFLDEENQKQAIASVRKGDNNWVLIGYQGQTNNIELIGTGSQGANELAQHLREDLIAMGIVRVEIKFDSQLVTRFALIEYVGNGISTVRKAKTVTFKGRISDFLGQSHVSISCSDKSELTNEIVIQKVTDIAGTANKVRDTTPTPTTTTPTPTTTTITSQPKQPTQPTSKAATGKSGASLVNNPKSGNAVNTASTGLSFNDPETCKTAIQEVRSDEIANDFALFGYVDNNPTKTSLCKIAGGTGGIEALKNAIENESNGAYYGLVRVDTVVQDTKTVKFVFVTYIGEGIKTIQKAKITTHFGAVKDLIGQYHTDLFASKKSELTEEIIKAKVNSVTFMTNTK